MATILPFVIRPRPLARKPDGVAKIIIFPGVRYEHRDEPPPHAASGERRGRKNKAR